MCGRYAAIADPEAMRRLFRYKERPNFPPRYNVAPTQPIAIVRMQSGERHFALVRWGLLPGWVKDPKTFALLINARGESVCDKPAFRAAMRYRRCLVPADGFYEWKRVGAGKQPYYVHLKSGEPFAFAGLWESWSGPNGEEMESAAIVTTDASREIAHIHERMPVILMPDAFDIWLDCERVDARTAAALIAPTREGLLAAHPVSTAVNRVADDDPRLIAAVAEGGATPTAPAAAARKVTLPARKTRRKDSRQGQLF